MKASWFIGAGIIVVVLLGGAAVFAWQIQPREPIEPTVIEFSDFDPEMRAIKVRGTAHYRSLIKQEAGASILGGGGTWWVYPLFGVYDTEGREVKILVRTREAPAQRVEFEFVELTGWVDPPRSHTVPMRTEQMLGVSNYYFSPDVMVLEPWEQRTFDPAE
ncbi:MAG: hypothetical protein AB8H79_20400 [Myxococcota bacterium]